MYAGVWRKHTERNLLFSLMVPKDPQEVLWAEDIWQDINVLQPITDVLKTNSGLTGTST